MYKKKRTSISIDNEASGDWNIDYDGDGVPNLFDCQPKNPKKDISFEDIQKKLTEGATFVREHRERVFGGVKQTVADIREKMREPIITPERARTIIRKMEVIPGLREISMHVRAERAEKDIPVQAADVTREIRHLEEQGAIKDNVLQSVNVNELNRIYSDNIKNNTFQHLESNKVEDEWGSYIQRGRITDPSGRRDYIMGNVFVGTEDQFNKYKADVDAAKIKDDVTFDKYQTKYDTAVEADKKLFEDYHKEFGEYEAAVIKHEKAYDASIHGKMATFTMKHMPEYEDLPFAIKKTDIPAVEVGRGITKAVYEEIREKPAELGMTALTFAALPPVLKGAGYIWGLRGAKAAVGAAKVLPKVTKYAPGAVGVGLLGTYIGVTGLDVSRALTPVKKGEVVGKAGIELAAMMGGGYVGVKGLPIPIRPGFGYATLPKGKAVSFGIKVGKKPGILKPEVFEEFYPIITRGKGGVKGISLGEPKVRGKLFEDILHEPKTIKEASKLFEPTTPLELRILRRVIPEEAAKIVESRLVRKYTIKAGVKVEELTPVIRETLAQHGLKKSTSTVIQLLKGEKADLYGSIMQEAATRKFGLTRRTPGDIDVKVTNIKNFTKKAIELINKAEGREAVILKGNKVIIKETGKKLFDVSSKTEFAEYGKQASDFLSYGLKEEPKIKTTEGITSITLSEQATRKLHGAMKISQEVREVGIGAMGDIPVIRGKIAPSYTGRIKDIADYYFIEKANIAGLKLKGKLISAKQANIHLEKWIESWGKDVKKYTKDLYAKTVRKEGGEKAWLGKFEDTPYSPSQSYRIVTQIKYVAPVSMIRDITPSTIPSSILTSQIPSTVSIMPSGIPSISSIMPSATPSKISKISSELSSIMDISKVQVTPSRITISKIKDKKSIIPIISIIPSKIPKKKEKLYKTPTYPIEYSLITTKQIVIPKLLIPPPRKKKKKVKVKKRKIRDWFKFGEIAPVATPKQALALLGVEVTKKGKKKKLEKVVLM